ncbi:MAG: copper chaperone PCu(A)C [Candidatus Eisenbacteria bacterium]
MALLVTLVGVLPATGCGGRRPAIAVTDAWARATPAASTVGAAYMRLASADGDRLIGVAVPPSVASAAELHEVVTDSLGRMQMRPVTGIDLPAGRTIELRPGGWHVMLVGLTRPLAAGGSIVVRLRFEKAAELAVRVTVRGS